ncbi:MAG: AraC family transcriptional regulator [Clostridiales bacterium]|nr:AraC family transcriptional regulator [Clostridiales bacterium]
MKKEENTVWMLLVAVIGHILCYIRHLLAHSGFRMSDICETVGISSTNHFYYLFKKRFGISPSQYESW